MSRPRRTHIILSFRAPLKMAVALDALVEKGIFPSRSEAIKFAVSEMLGSYSVFSETFDCFERELEDFDLWYAKNWKDEEQVREKVLTLLGLWKMMQQSHSLAEKASELLQSVRFLSEACEKVGIPPSVFSPPVKAIAEANLDAVEQVAGKEMRDLLELVRHYTQSPPEET